jgi:hypothetical protein
MEPRTEPTTLDLAALEERLERRACWHDDPGAYRAGVRDTLAAVREAPEVRDGGSRLVRAG